MQINLRKFMHIRAIYHRENFLQIVQYKMAFYKEKTQKQLKKTLENFRNAQNRSLKTHLIEKQSKKRRLFKLQKPYYQQCRPTSPLSSSHILNFYNILSINLHTLKNDEHSESLIQSLFYYKTIRKIEVKENYVILFLNQSEYIQDPIQETLSKFRSDSHPKVRQIGSLLQNLAKKLDFGSINKETGISLTSETYEMLDSLGTVPFICKIFSQKLILSKSFLDLKQYPTEEFIIESLKYKLPLFEMMTSRNYYQIIKKQIEFYSQLIDVLQGGIPFASFLETAQLQFMDTITSKTKVDHFCQMSLSMPIPLVELIKVEKILETVQNYNQDQQQLFGEKFRMFQSKIRGKQHKTLNNLIGLPSNFKPELSQSVATYIDLKRTRMDEDERKYEGFDLEKNSLTLSYS